MFGQMNENMDMLATPPSLINEAGETQFNPKNSMVNMLFDENADEQRLPY